MGRGRLACTGWDAPLGEGPCPRPQSRRPTFFTYPLSPLSCDVALRLSLGLLPAPAVSNPRTESFKWPRTEHRTHKTN